MHCITRAKTLFLTIAFNAQWQLFLRIQYLTHVSMVTESLTDRCLNLDIIYGSPAKSHMNYLNTRFFK